MCTYSVSSKHVNSVFTGQSGIECMLVDMGRGCGCESVHMHE